MCVRGWAAAETPHGASLQKGARGFRFAGDLGRWGPPISFCARQISSWAQDMGLYFRR